MMVGSVSSGLVCCSGKGFRVSQVVIFGYTLVFLVSMAVAMASPSVDYRLEKLDSTDVQRTLTSMPENSAGNESSRSPPNRFRRQAHHVPICLPGMQRPCIQPQVTCNDAEVYRCYDEFTATGFFYWLGINVNNGNFSQERLEKVCRSLGPVSVCKADMYSKCLGDVRKYSLNEKAYRSQRDIFCQKRNLTAYLRERVCLRHDKDYVKCIEESIANVSAAKEMTSKHAACETAAALLYCTEGISNGCFKNDGTSMYRKVRFNEAALAGCIKEHAPSKGSSTASYNCSSLLLLAAAAFLWGRHRLCGAS
ncbi:uncharacterized protein LOC144157776 [Haemaphysalis longicornis]